MEITALPVHCATVSSALSHTYTHTHRRAITASSGMRRGDSRESLATRDRLRSDTLDDGQRAGKGASSGKKGNRMEEEERDGATRRGCTTEREKESARDCPPMQPRARLAAAASPHLCTSTHAISISPVLHRRRASPPSSPLFSLRYSRASETQCGVGAGRCCAGALAMGGGERDGDGGGGGGGGAGVLAVAAVQN
jgi:hypothetical protein